MKTIIILGFGRSGTTWIADIVSKVTGQLILFEPLHPQATEHAQRFAYSRADGAEDSALLTDHLTAVLDKTTRAKWLLRNHIPVDFDKVDDAFLNSLWRECNVLGFKEIRANFLIDWFQNNLDSTIVYIVRHPCAVIASIRQRINFWKEFGWPRNYQLFLERTIYDDAYRDHRIQGARSMVEEATADVEKQAIMWAITHAVVLPELERLGLPLFLYEDFYVHPFDSVRALLRYLGRVDLSIHPSHIFTPSMTSLKTVHGLHDDAYLVQQGPAVFWKEVLSEAEVDVVMGIVESLGIGLYDGRGVAADRPGVAAHAPRPAGRRGNLSGPGSADSIE